MKIILKKLHAVQQRLVVEKTRHNAFGDFKYRSAEDILLALKPLLAENNLILFFNDDVENIGDKNYIRACASLVDVESGERIDAHAFAAEPKDPKAKMDASQTTGSTSSYARKYALNGLFAIDDEKDSDATNNKAPKAAKTATAAVKTITAEQKKKLEELDVNLTEFATYAKSKTVDEIPFEMAQASILKREKAAKPAVATGVAK